MSDDAVLLGERIPGGQPGLVDGCFPLLQEFRFVETAVVHILYEKIDLIRFGDGGLEADAIALAFVQLAGVRGDVLVRRVAPRRVEASLGLDLLFVRDDGPSSNVLEERVDGFVVVADVLFPLLFEVLRVDDLFDGGDAAVVDGFLQVVILPERLLLLLELEQSTTFCFVGDRWIDGVWLRDRAAVQVVDAAREAHFGLVEDEGEAAVVPFPLAGGETAGDLGELSDEELDARR